MKKIFAIILALAMTFALSATALAAQEIGENDADNPGTITIENAARGKDYKVYKVFDATYSEGAVSYTYTKAEGTDALYNALIAADSPFTLTQIGQTSTYQVTIKTTVPDPDHEGQTITVDGAYVGNWLKSKESLLGNPTAETPTGGATDDTLIFHVPYGYYYITTSLGNAVTVDTAAPSVTVHDKNGKPGFEGGKKSVVDGNGTVINSPTANIGDTIHFKIEANVPKFNGDNPVITYKFEDTMGAGLTYADNLVIKLHDGSGREMTLTTAQYTLVAPTTENGNKLTISFHPNSDTENSITGIEGYYPDAHVVITYDAKVNENATADNITNSVRMFVDDVDTTPEGDDPPHTETETYGFNLEKRKGDTTEILQNAEFTLYKTRTGSEGNYTYSDPVKFSEVTPAPESFNKAYRVDPNGSETIVAGKTRIWGLAAGTYYLVETKAPTGYNPLIGDTEVTVGSTGADNDNIMTESVTVKNEVGGSLPGVGGIGTTIFYIIGGLLMVGAAVLLVVRKKMSVTE